VKPFRVVLRLVPVCFLRQVFGKKECSVFHGLSCARIYARTTPGISPTRAYRHGTRRTRGTKIVFNSLECSMSSQDEEQTWNKVDCAKSLGQKRPFLTLSEAPHFA
jgi:hypothetical protein